MNIFDRLYDSIFPIIFFDNNKNVYIAGTSILVEVNSQPHLLTAAHVLRRNGKENQLYLSLKDNAILLHEPAVMTKLPKHEEEPDLDIAYFPLLCHPRLSTYLNGYKSISLNDINETIAYTREQYFVFGYPWRKAKYNDENKILSTNPLKYFTDPITDKSIYTKLYRPEQSHILVQYNPKNTKNRDGKKQHAPHPHGISGGPIFKALINECDEVIVLIIEGLLIEWRNSKIIVATRKKTIRDFIESDPLYKVRT